MNPPKKAPLSGSLLGNPIVSSYEHTLLPYELVFHSSLKDKATAAHGPPFVSANHATMNLLNKKGSTNRLSPGHRIYRIWCLGYHITDWVTTEQAPVPTNGTNSLLFHLKGFSGRTIASDETNAAASGVEAETCTFSVPLQSFLWWNDYIKWYDEPRLIMDYGDHPPSLPGRLELVAYYPDGTEACLGEMQVWFLVETGGA